MIAWTPAERRAWKPPDRLGVIDWTERFRVLGPDQSAMPGPMRYDRAPHTRGIATLLESARRLGIEAVWVQKSGQVAVSETIRSFIGWLADQRPTPTMLILPSEAKGREVVANRLVPMFESCEPLRALHTDDARDISKSLISLTNGFTLYLAWSGSPTSLASHPIGVIFADEVDKFSTDLSREADPLSLAMHRLKTYGGEQLFVAASTPTTEDGPITTGREACPVQLRYFCPCPLCGAYQTIDWSRMRWPPAAAGETRDAHANRIAIDRDAWLECAECKGEIHEDKRKAMQSAGVWASIQAVDQRDFPAWAAASSRYGIVFESWPKGRKVGLHIGDQSVLWVDWWRMAEEWIRSEGNVEARRDFHNSRLGEPHRVIVKAEAPERFAAKSAAAKYPAEWVPEWATELLATADTQKDHFYYVVRAWGPKLRSARVAHGAAATFDELRRLTIESVFDRIGGGGGQMAPSLLGIDVGGTRTQEVYQFILEDPHRIVGMRGANRRIERGIDRSRANYRPPPGMDYANLPDLWITDIDTDRYKDRLAAMIAAKAQILVAGEIVEVEQWDLNQQDDNDYNRQMTAERRIQKRVNGRPVYTWEKVTDSADNHYWDCEVYQVAMTDVVRVGEQPERIVMQTAEAYRPSVPRSMPDYLRPRKGLPPPRGGRWR